MAKRRLKQRKFEMTTEVVGLDAVVEMLNDTADDLTADSPVMRDALKFSAETLRRDAQNFSEPADTGDLKKSIIAEIRINANRILAAVRSWRVYAPYVELGTRPHFPPLKALEGWARRHGTTAFVVARAIARRGTKARQFFQKAFDRNTTRIHSNIRNTVAGILKDRARKARRGKNR